jgi:acetate kinase
MNILVINAGSSSVKFKIFSIPSYSCIGKGSIDRIGHVRSNVSIECNDKKRELTEQIVDHTSAIDTMLHSIDDFLGLDAIQGVGHRVVHGGEKYAHSVRIDDEVIADLKRLSSLAPLHNPVNIEGITACMKILPDISQVAVFDTAFHQTIPKENYLYAIPHSLYTEQKIRRYGFHGTSHKYVSEKARSFLKDHDLPTDRLIVCHLGNGSSITAIKKGESVNTTMGFTPLAGIPMGTRSGSIDPGIVLHLLTQDGYDAKAVSRMLNKESGLYGLCGDSDMREIHKKYVTSSQHKEAFDILVGRIAETIGAYQVTLGGCDAIVFTGGMGENAAYLRDAVIDRFFWQGISLDEQENASKDSLLISNADSSCAVLRIKTDEEYMIAKETVALVQKV